MAKPDTSDQLKKVVGSIDQLAEVVGMIAADTQDLLIKNFQLTKVSEEFGKGLINLGHIAVSTFVFGQFLPSVIKLDTGNFIFGIVAAGLAYFGAYQLLRE